MMAVLTNNFALLSIDVILSVYVLSTAMQGGSTSGLVCGFHEAQLALAPLKLKEAANNSITSAGSTYTMFFSFSFEEVVLSQEK
jgi:hypothetical protein